MLSLAASCCVKRLVALLLLCGSGRAARTSRPKGPTGDAPLLPWLGPAGRGGSLAQAHGGAVAGGEGELAGATAAAPALPAVRGQRPPRNHNAGQIGDAGRLGRARHAPRLVLLEDQEHRRASAAEGLATRQLLADMGRLEDQFEAAKAREVRLREQLIAKQTQVATAEAARREAMRSWQAAEAWTRNLQMTVVGTLGSFLLLALGVRLGLGTPATNCLKAAKDAPPPGESLDDGEGTAGAPPESPSPPQSQPKAGAKTPETAPTAAEMEEPAAAAAPGCPEPQEQPALPPVEAEVAAATTPPPGIKAAPAPGCASEAEASDGAAAPQPAACSEEGGSDGEEPRCVYFNLADDAPPPEGAIAEDWWTRDERSPRCCF